MASRSQNNLKSSESAEAPVDTDRIDHMLTVSSSNTDNILDRKYTELKDFDPCNTYPSDRGHFKNELSNNLIEVLARHGSCQPSKMIKIESGQTFNPAHYYYRNLKLFSVKRDWFSCSEKLGTVYCHNCWLLARNTSNNKDSPWIDGFIPNTKRLKQQIERHEESIAHKEATKSLAQLKAGKGINMLNEAGIAKIKNFWREVLRRIIVIILTLANLCLPFRGHREVIGNGRCEGGNFLGLVNMQLRMGDGDPYFKQLVGSKARKCRYLSPTIQNEMIEILANATRLKFVEKIKVAPCFTLIFDTTSDICRVDQISIVVRWVDMEAATVVETFLGFIPAKQGGTAKALTDTVLDYLRRIGWDPKQIRGQGYDGASVMSGSKGSVNVLISNYLKSEGITSPAPFVHCASHNLNLVVNDAVECNADSINFFADLEEIYAFFNRSINRTADLNSTDLSVIDEFTNEVSFDSDTDSDDTAINVGSTTQAKKKKQRKVKIKLTLKKLCATRWSSRINSVRAVKNRYRDLLHVLDNLKRKGKDNVKEREEAASLHLKLNKFEFVVMLIIWEKLLAAIQIASANLQSNKIDLSRSAKELERAMRKISGMRDKWDAIKMEAVKFALKVGVSCTFAFKRVRRVPRFYDEFASDSRPQDPEERFTVEMFYQVIDTATNQLEERFRSQKFLADTFKFVLPGSLATLDITEVRKSAELFVNEYKGDICTDGVEVADYISDLVNEIKSFRWCYGMY
ncbi:zinc finger MYM-type protein 1-like [Dendronephthya gigantea]|uniref:zinc finger MYM-type protein 1-like n=1 Tax=Dendronephthya gigantea TaxID=151771 RepID=UPI00106BF301|nr:zinc finger MYM-type protein 1-like [Dendronephthya gigantea]